MRIDSRKPKAAALSAALTVALLAGAGATDAHAATLSDTVGSTPSETTLVQPVDYRGDGYGSMQEWNASMEAKRDSLEMRAQIIMNMYGDYATDDERAVLQGCIDGAGSLLTMGEVDAKSTELDELRTALEDAKREALEAAAAEAEAETQQQLNCYADVCEQDLAIPVVKGRKTDKEKFAGAEATYTIEAMMKDGKALQSGTSHYFGDKFSKAYDVTFTGRDNQLHHPFQTSWGVSTRLVGAIIMTHGDDDGLILPPAVAPIQVVVVPIAAHKPGVSEKAAELAEKISKYARVKLDDSDNAPGWKFSQWEMKGVPLRLEIGPKDLEKNQCVLVRRDTREKVFVSLDELETAIPAQLEALRKDLYERALANREKRTWAATTMDQVKELAKANTGYIKTMWCGDLACEMKMKEEVGLSSRCMPFEQEHLSDVCPCCGKPAKTMVYWGVAY